MVLALPAATVEGFAGPWCKQSSRGPNFSRVILGSYKTHELLLMAGHLTERGPGQMPDLPAPSLAPPLRSAVTAVSIA